MLDLNKDALFVNYLEFMSLFRGSIERTPDLAVVRSEKKEFTFSIPLNEEGLAKEIENPSTTILLVPAHLNWAGSSKWKASNSISFMEIRNAKSSKGKPTSAHLVSGNDSKIAGDFSKAQCAGFLETPEAYSGWAKFLTEANQKNVNNKNIAYYVAYVSEDPVSGAIVVKSPSSIGIYGVATKPSHRKQGLSTLSLDQIAKDFKSEGTVGLQVETGSYAHKYYKGLGFEETYELKRFVIS